MSVNTAYTDMLLTEMINAKLVAYAKNVPVKPRLIYTINFSKIQTLQLQKIFPGATINGVTPSDILKSATAPIDLLIANIASVNNLNLTDTLANAKRLLSENGIFIFAVFNHESLRIIKNYITQIKVEGLADERVAIRKLNDTHLLKYIVFKEHLLFLEEIKSYINCNLFLATNQSMIKRLRELLVYSDNRLSEEEITACTEENSEVAESKETKENAEPEESEEPEEKETAESESESAEKEELELAEKPEAEIPEEVTELADANERPEVEIKEQEMSEDREDDEPKESESSEEMAEADVTEQNEPAEKTEIPETVENPETETEKPEEAELNEAPEAKEDQEQEHAEEENPEAEEKEVEEKEPELKDEPEEQEAEESEEDETEEAEETEEQEDEQEEEESEPSEPAEQEHANEPKEKEEPEQKESHEEAKELNTETIAEKLTEHKEVLNEHAEKLAQHLESGASIMKQLTLTGGTLAERQAQYNMLQQHFQQHKQLVADYKTAYGQHREMVNNFIAAHENSMEHDPVKNAQYHELLAKHQAMLQQHSEEITRHDELLNSGLGI